MNLVSSGVEVTTGTEEHHDVPALLAEIDRLNAKVLQLQNENDQYIGDAQWVAALEAAGVDNWSGYGEAQEIMLQNQTP